MIADTIAGDTLALCVVWAVVIGLLVGGLAWLIPPSRPYCAAIGLVVGILVILSCLV